jgi:hypothetical protein
MKLRRWVWVPLFAPSFKKVWIRPRSTYGLNSSHRFSADLTLYWFPVCHFRCKEFNPLVIWLWNQNIAISTIVGTNMIIGVRSDTPETNTGLNLQKIGAQ